jgi:hypothetical protein
VNPGDSRHADTVAALDLGEFRWAVTHPNLVEAWNFLTGSVKRVDLAHALMEWVMTPGNVLLIGDADETILTAHDYSKRMRIDIVDAGLIDIADRITKSCGMVPAVHVATYDVRDFLRLFGSKDFQFHVYDMRDVSSTAALA